jgi:hypothetical protein
MMNDEMSSTPSTVDAVDRRRHRRVHCFRRWNWKYAGAFDGDDDYYGYHGKEHDLWSPIYPSVDSFY